MQLVIPWDASLNPCLLMEYDGNTQAVTPSNRIPYFPDRCRHFADIDNLGDRLETELSTRRHMIAIVLPIG